MNTALKSEQIYSCEGSLCTFKSDMVGPQKIINLQTRSLEQTQQKRGLDGTNFSRNKVLNKQRDLWVLGLKSKAVLGREFYFKSVKETME